jgi:hypothetical protein
MAIPAVLAALGRSGAAGGAGGAGAPAALQSVATQLGNVRGMASQAAGSLDRVSGAFASMSRHIVKTLTGALDLVKGLAAPMAGLVGLRNPAAIKQFTLAVNDASAVLGEILLPVFNALIRAARTVGDTYATLQSAIEPVFDGIADAIDTVFKEIGSVAKENAGALKVMGEAMGWVARVLGHAAANAIWLADKLGKLLNPIMGIAKLIGGGGAEGGESARGRAIRNVSITQHGEDVARKAQEAAFMAALQTKPEKPPEVGLLEQILDFLNEHLKIDNFKDLLGGIAGDIAKALLDLLRDNPQAVTGTKDVGPAGWIAKSLLTR